MTLLTVVNDVCAAVGVHATQSVVTSINTNRTMFEMLALANEMAQRVATDTRDWTVLRKTTAPTALVGDGISEAFNLPTDFRRLLTDSNVWRSTSVLQPMRFIPNTDEWQQRRNANYSQAYGEWTIFGGQIHIWPIMAGAIAAVGSKPAVPAVTARLSYLDKNSVEQRDPAGTLQKLSESFTTDNDTWRLPERILKLGMIWQWKAHKGSPYAEDMGTWTDAMALAMGNDSPAPIMVDRYPISRAAKQAYPWYPVPTP